MTIRQKQGFKSLFRWGPLGLQLRSFFALGLMTALFASPIFAAKLGNNRTVAGFTPYLEVTHSAPRERRNTHSHAGAWERGKIFNFMVLR